MMGLFGAWAREVKGTRPLVLARMRARAALNAAWKGATDTLFPPTCLTCDTGVPELGTLCATCWRDTPFMTGLTCERCGIEQPGDPRDAPVTCDGCQQNPPPWNRGRAALAYEGAGRRLVLSLKYADRHDIVAPAGRWLHSVAAPLMRADTVIAPVPLHRLRLFRRRYNQSALLAHALARRSGKPCIPDLLLRPRATALQDGRSRDARFANLDGAIVPNPKRETAITGRHVLLIDDVMTSGATLSAATHACYLAGADAVDVAVLARVGRER